MLETQREVLLSSVFIEPLQWDESGLYGTRTHSVVVLGQKGFLFVEETLDTKTMRWKQSEIAEGEPMSEIRAKL